MFAAAAYRAVWDRLPIPTPPRRRGGAPGFDGVEIGSFGRRANDDAVALGNSKDREEAFRSRAGPYAGGESPATSLAAPPDPIYPLRSSRREQVADRRPARCTAALSVTTVWLWRSDCSRRDTRQSVKRFGSGPIGGGDDSPLTHRPPGYRHDVHGRADQSAAAVIDQHARGRAVFPRRRTGAKFQPTPSSLRQGAPVNRRLGGRVEDALGFGFVHVGASPRGWRRFARHEDHLEQLHPSSGERCLRAGEVQLPRAPERLAIRRADLIFG